jgi:ankyrin repeat protein
MTVTSENTKKVSHCVITGKEGGKRLDLNAKNSDGHTPLSLSLRLGLKHQVPQLIAAGADINVKDAEGLTLLHQALLNGDSETALFLLEQGANMACL